VARQEANAASSCRSLSSEKLSFIWLHHNAK
jgi:hypothetical protein